MVLSGMMKTLKRKEKILVRIIKEPIIDEDILKLYGSGVVNAGSPNTL